MKILKLLKRLHTAIKQQACDHEYDDAIYINAVAKRYIEKDELVSDNDVLLIKGENFKICFHCGFEKTVRYQKDVGVSTGDRCWRYGCQGIIEKVEGSCSCHTGNPPCSYCTDAPVLCYVCGWEESFEDRIN
jgi:hypothetical protein